MRPIYEYCLECIHGELVNYRDDTALEARCRLEEYERLVVHPCKYTPGPRSLPTQFKFRNRVRSEYSQAWSTIFGMYLKESLTQAEFYADEAISRIVTE